MAATEAMTRRPDPAPRDTWLAQREVGNDLGIRIVVGTVRLFGRRGGRSLIVPIAFYYALFGALRGSVAYRASRDYLARLHSRVTFWMVVRHIRTFAECALDRMFHAMGRTELFEIDRNGKEHLAALHRDRKGAILLGAHLGSFEVLRTMSRKETLRLNILVHFSNARRITKFLRAVAPDFDGRVIEIDPANPSFILEVKERIEAGEIVAVLGDRTGLGESTVEVEFLGGTAKFPTGPYVLAAALRCPIYLTFGLYHPPRRYSLYCEPFCERVDLPRGQREAGVRELAQRYARRLEYYCRLAPYNWFNFFDMWR